jgi:GntR family transcriptional regulator
MDFRIDPASGVAPYLQLVQQIKQGLRLGWLQVGDKLPTVHEVAAAAAVNPNTVLKAYRELEHEGLAVGRPGQGTFITRSLNQLTPAAFGVLSRRLERWITAAREAGLDDDGIADIVAVALRAGRSEETA